MYLFFLAYLWQTCSKDNHLINLSHSFHKSIHARSFQYKDIMGLSIDLDRYDEISIHSHLPIMVRVREYANLTSSDA